MPDAIRHPWLIDDALTGVKWIADQVRNDNSKCLSFPPPSLNPAKAGIHDPFLRREAGFMDRGSSPQ